MPPDAAPPSRAMPTPAAPGNPLLASGPEQVMQAKRHDCVDLAPSGRPRRQSLRGFDPIRTGIVDCIVRCTHRIWDERDVGLICTHHDHPPPQWGVVMQARGCF